MRNKRIFLFSTLVLIFICLFTSCSPVIKVAVASDGAVSYAVESSVSPLIEDTVRSFTGADKSLSLFNKTQILEALETAGLASVKVETPSSSSLLVSADIKAVPPSNSNLPSLGDGVTCQDMVPQVAGAIGYCHSTKVGQRKLILTISPDVLQQVMEIIPAETAEYLSLLSAPVFTGEKISASEYLELVGIIYGNSVAQELKKAQVRILVTAPAKIQSATVSVPSGKARKQDQYVEFTLGLTELLTNQDRIEFTVQY